MAVAMMCSIAAQKRRALQSICEPSKSYFLLGENEEAILLLKIRKKYLGRKQVKIAPPRLKLCVPVDLDEMNKNHRSDARSCRNKKGKHWFFATIVGQLFGPLGRILQVGGTGRQASSMTQTLQVSLAGA